MSDIHLEVKLNANIAAVYEAWTLPEALQKWFAPINMTVTQAMSNFQEGGTFRLQLLDELGNIHLLVGNYLQVLPDEQLQFSWQWADENHQTLVDVKFIDERDSTLLQLTHSGFEDQEDYELHTQAWLDCLEKLSVFVLN